LALAKSKIPLYLQPFNERKKDGAVAQFVVFHNDEGVIEKQDPAIGGMVETKFGAVAQLVEQWTENPCVAGSIPAHTTALKTLTEMLGFFITEIFLKILVSTWFHV
jgi:hypothetical protein